jgi:hypothetical protein
MKLKSSPSGAPCPRMRRASSNSEFLFNSSCPRTAEVLAGESRNTRDRGGLQSEGLAPSSRSCDTSFIGGILLVLSREVLLVIIFKTLPASAAHEMEQGRIILDLDEEVRGVVFRLIATSTALLRWRNPSRERG